MAAIKFDENRPHQMYFAPVKDAPSRGRILQDGEWFDHLGRHLATKPLPPPVKRVPDPEPAEFNVETADKDALESFARSHGVELDKRRSLAFLRDQVRALL